ncbi:MAG: threonine/serine dehydratase [Candidatus Eiseniibacteriota bacterium]
MIPLAEIRAAADRIRGRIHRTPILSATSIGERMGVSLRLKCESFQKTGSFKSRGALNKILTLSVAERAKGLITVSAGNHAQAVAWAAREVGVPATVVMPSWAPKAKLDAVRGYGAEVILHNDNATLFDRMREVERERGAVFIHPFDDPVVVAGAGTVGLEIMEDAPDAAAVVVPVGGGGLMSGVACAVVALNPKAKIYAVELEAGPGLGPALEAGKPVPVARPTDTLADGMTPPFVGAIALEVTRKMVHEVVRVSEREIIDAMRLLFTRAKLYVEGSGAAAVAALLSGKIRLKQGTPVTALVSGGNLDLDRACAALMPESRG